MAVLVAWVAPVTGSTAAGELEARCSLRTSILKSPRMGSEEVQVKALNDRGDMVGFADGTDGTDHAILWKRGRSARAVDLGVPPGYVSSEAYGVNNRRVVFGVLYDKQERTFPFRWARGRMTVLKGPNGRKRQVLIPDRNAINGRGQIAATLLIGGDFRAVRWDGKGRPTILPALPGHAWTLAWGINRRGVVSGWSRREPNEDGENNPVIWTGSSTIIALATEPGRADGAAEATNRRGLTVGYLGNLGTATDPESGQAAVWPTSTAAPRLFGPPIPYAYGELVDVNDRGQAAGMVGSFTKSGFTVVRPAVWRTGWPRLRVIPVPTASRRANRVVITQLQDINARGAIVGNVFGLTGKAYSKLRRVDPVVWTCAFGRRPA